MIESERLGSRAFLPRWIRREHDARYRFAARHVRGANVVDCACGTGVGAAAFAQAGARRVLGFDAAPDAVAEAKARGVAAAEFEIASGLALPVDGGWADVFISLETIEHIPEDERFLDEVLRVLRPGGTFVCSTPNRAVTNPGTTLADHPVNPFHVREYTSDEFHVLLRARFDEVVLHGQNPRNARWVALLTALGGAPGRLAARVNQASKFAYLLPGRSAEHEVRPVPPSGACEYLVAVCRRPRA